MSQLSEWIAWQLNQRFPALRIHQDMDEALFSIESNQEWSYQEAKRVAFAFEPFWQEIKGKNILDIGTGLGGKQRFYSQSGAKTITGIDISPRYTQVTRQMAQNKGILQVLHLSACDAAHMPFADNTFDAIVSINVFEHIMNVEGAVNETFRILKPDGVVFLHLPPYYGPWGPHLEHWIHFPWPHLLFSDRTLMRVAARVDTITQINSRIIKEAQIDWQTAGDRVPNVNKVTLSRFDRLIHQAGFTVLQRKLLTVGYQRIKDSPSPMERVVWGLMNAGQHIPLLREAIVTKMVYVLTKKLPFNGNQA